MGMGGLFQGGVPKLRPVGGKKCSFRQGSFLPVFSSTYQISQPRLMLSHEFAPLKLNS